MTALILSFNSKTIYRPDTRIIGLADNINWIFALILSISQYLKPGHIFKELHYKEVTEDGLWLFKKERKLGRQKVMLVFVNKVSRANLIH